MNFNFYTREDAPSCYEASLFEDENELNYLIQTFLFGGFSWYWMSERQWEPLEEYEAWNLPKLRYLTLVNEETKQLLYQDFLEEDTDSRRRTVVVFGIEINQTISSSSDLRDKLMNFLINENATIKCVINQINDMKPQYIFVPNNPENKIQILLNSWGLEKDSVSNTYKYKRLNIAQLEYMIDSIADTAFP